VTTWAPVRGERVLHVGLDDTDTIGSPGTNQLAREIADALNGVAVVEFIVRHQLFEDARVPFTSANGSASMLVRSARGFSLHDLADLVRERTRRFSPPGSDPGFCVAAHVPPEVTTFGRRCQYELIAQSEARALAAAHSLVLEGLGGTEDGVIGALAAVGLLAAGDDGRVIHATGWQWPDALGGVREAREIFDRGVSEIRDIATGGQVQAGCIDLGKRLRPAYRGGRIVLFVERLQRQADDGREEALWRALKLK